MNVVQCVVLGVITRRAAKQKVSTILNQLELFELWKRLPPQLFFAFTNTHLYTHIYNMELDIRLKKVMLGVWFMNALWL